MVLNHGQVVIWLNAKLWLRKLPSYFKTNLKTMILYNLYTNVMTVKQSKSNTVTSYFTFAHKKCLLRDLCWVFSPHQKHIDTQTTTRKFGAGYAWYVHWAKTGRKKNWHVQTSHCYPRKLTDFQTYFDTKIVSISAKNILSTKLPIYWDNNDWSFNV